MKIAHGKRTFFLSSVAGFSMFFMNSCSSKTPSSNSQDHVIVIAEKNYELIAGKSLSRLVVGSHIKDILTYSGDYGNYYYANGQVKRVFEGTFYGSYVIKNDMLCTNIHLEVCEFIVKSNDNYYRIRDRNSSAHPMPVKISKI